MKLPTLTQIAKGTAEFLSYKNGELRYRLEWTDDGEMEQVEYLDFPIPISDAGDGYFLPTMKGMNLLRWARKHVDLLKEGSVAHEVVYVPTEANLPILEAGKNVK